MELLQSILENSFDATLATDETGRIIFLNKRAREYPALATHELIISSLKKALQGETVTELEMNFASRDFLVNAQGLFNEQNHIIGAMISLQDITESKQTNERLFSRFGAVFYQSPFSIQIFSKDGRTLMVNHAYCSLWGISEELVENYVYKLYNILEDQFLKESGQLSYILRGFEGEIVQVPPFYYDPSKLGFPGRPRWAGGLVYPLKDAQGAVQEVVIIHRDMTDQYIATQEKEELLSQLITERNRLETILNQIPVGVLVADAPYGDISFRNKRLMEESGGIPSVGSLAELNELKIYFPDGRSYTYNEYPVVRSLKGEIVRDEEVTIIHTNGKHSVLSVSSAPIRDLNGKITSSVAVATDVTQKIRMENVHQFLNRMKTMLLTTLDIEQNMNEFVKICVPFLCDGCFVDIIEGTTIKRARIHHWDPKLKELMEEISAAYPPQLSSQMPTMRTLQTGHVHFERKMDYEALARTCVNEDHLNKILNLGINSLITVPLQIRNKTFGSISFLSTTPERLLDDIDLSTCLEVGKHASLALDNALLYREARRAVKLREEFIYLASHELKTPLTSMKLQIDVLKNIMKGLNTEDSGYALKVLGKTHKQIDRLTKLINDMLDFSHIESGKFTISKEDH